MEVKMDVTNGCCNGYNKFHVNICKKREGKNHVQKPKGYGTLRMIY